VRSVDDVEAPGSIEPHTAYANGDAPSASPRTDPAPNPGTGNTGPQPAELSAAELSEIAELALRIALVDKKVPDFNLLPNPKRVVISTPNSTVQLPKLPGIRLVLLTPDAIQAKANKEGDFLYIELGTPSPCKGRYCLDVKTRWAVSEGPRATVTIHLSGGGMQLIFGRTESARWQVTIGVMWIS